MTIVIYIEIEIRTPPRSNLSGVISIRIDLIGTMHDLPYSGKTLRDLTFAFFAIWGKSRKLIREIVCRILFHCIQQGSLAIMALLKYLQFSRGLFLILNARCQAQ